MRLIDKDSLMEELEREVELADDWKTAHEIANVVKYAPTVYCWHDVSERPPRTGRYLVWGSTYIVPYHGEQPNAFWSMRFADWFQASGWDSKVKYWCVLPEPPKEVNSETD